MISFYIHTLCFVADLLYDRDIPLLRRQCTWNRLYTRPMYTSATHTFSKCFKKDGGDYTGPFRSLSKFERASCRLLILKSSMMRAYNDSLNEVLSVTLPLFPRPSPSTPFLSLDIYVYKFFHNIVMWHGNTAFIYC